MRQIDEAVAEVFQVMLDKPCAVLHASCPCLAQVRASVSLAGAVQAQCSVEFSTESARQLTSAFLGEAPPDPSDEAILADTVGELCNMIAGGWKKRLGPQACDTNLSVPSTSLCRPVECAAPPQAPVHSRAYSFDGSSFIVSLTLIKAPG